MKKKTLVPFQRLIESLRQSQDFSLHTASLSSTKQHPLYGRRQCGQNHLWMSRTTLKWLQILLLKLWDQLYWWEWKINWRNDFISISVQLNATKNGSKSWCIGWKWLIGLATKALLILPMTRAKVPDLSSFEKQKFLRHQNTIKKIIQLSDFQNNLFPIVNESMNITRAQAHA